jgi:hypothetical protein
MQYLKVFLRDLIKSMYHKNIHAPTVLRIFEMPFDDDVLTFELVL